VGIDANGKVAVAFGDVGSSAYFYRISVDCWVSRYGTDVSTGWSIDRNTTYVSASNQFSWKYLTGPMTSSIKGAVAINATGKVNITGLGTSSAVYTDGSGNLTTTIPTSSSLGYWTRNSGSGYLYNTTSSDFVGVGTTAPSAKLHIAGGGAIIGTNGTTANTRTLTILADGQSQINHGPYPGAWTAALQIQNNDNSRLLWLSPLDGASGANARLRSCVTGFDIYTGGTTTDAGTLGISQNSSGNVGIGTTSVTSGFRLDVSGNIHTTGDIVSDGNYGLGLVGIYDPTKYRNVYSMGAAYRLAANGTSPGNLYGIAMTYEPNYGGSGNNAQAYAGLGHQFLFMSNGVTQTAIGTGLYTLGNATIGGNLRRTDHAAGFLEGSYNNVGANDAQSNPIYTIGSNYNPTNTSLSNMYGVGYSHSNFWGSAGNRPADWGLYVSAAGVIRVILDAGSGILGLGAAKGSNYVRYR